MAKTDSFLLGSAACVIRTVNWLGKNAYPFAMMTINILLKIALFNCLCLAHVCTFNSNEAYYNEADSVNISKYKRLGHDSTQFTIQRFRLKMREFGLMTSFSESM